MRTYQYVRAGNGFEAVGNMLVVGTAFIWVPVLALWLGWNAFSQWAQIGDYSPKVVAEQKAKRAEAERKTWLENNRVDRDASGTIVWVNPKGNHQRASDVLPISNPNSPKQGWLIDAGSFTHALSDQRGHRCVRGEYLFTTYRTGGGQAGGGCYEIINNVIVLHIGERELYFDKGAAVEGFWLTNAQAGRLGLATTKSAQAAPKPRWQDAPIDKPQTVADARAQYERATEAYNTACKYGCGGAPLKQWQAARDNLAMVVARSN